MREITTHKSHDEDRQPVLAALLDELEALWRVREAAVEARHLLVGAAARGRFDGEYYHEATQIICGLENALEATK